jgi:hypothetical protein
MKGATSAVLPQVFGLAGLPRDTSERKLPMLPAVEQSEVYMQRKSCDTK